MHVIYSYGGGEYLYSIFNFIAMLIYSNNGISGNVLRIISLVAVLWVIIKMYSKASLIPGLSFLVWIVLASTMIVAPKTTISIDDPISFGRARKNVANVPFILGATVSIISNISHHITTMIESTFTLPSTGLGEYQQTGYTQAGSVFGSKLIMKLKDVRIDDPDFNANLTNFVQQCVVYDAAIGLKYNFKDLKESQNIWQLVSANTSKILGFPYKGKAMLIANDGANPRETYINKIVTCKEGVGLLNSKWNEQINKVASRAAGGIMGINLFNSNANNQHSLDSAKIAFLSKLPLAMKMMGGASQQGADLLKQQMMMNVVKDASRQKAVQLGANLALSKAQLQQKNSYQLSGMLAEESLLIMQVVFECLLYSAFVFIYLFLFIPGGYMVLLQYFQAVIWVQLWPSLFAILNFIMNFYAWYKSSSLLRGSGLARDNSEALLDLHTGVANMAGWLSLSIPFISWMIVSKGGAAAFVHLSSHLTSASQAAIQGAAASQTEGNISLGNYNDGNTSLNNFSANKSNTNLEHQSGVTMRNTASGGLIAHNKGNIVYMGGQGKSISSFGTDLMNNQSLATQLNTQSSKETALMESKATEYAAARNSTVRDLAEFMQRASNSESSTKNTAFDQSFSSNKALQNTLSFAQHLKENYGLSSATSMQAAVVASASMGANANLDFGIGSLNAGIKTHGDKSYQSSSGRTLSHDNLKDLARNYGYNQSLDALVRASKSLNLAENQVQEKALLNNASASYETSKSLRDSISTHQQNSERLSNAASLMETSGFNINTSMNQDFYNYVANSTSSNGKGKVGYNTAAEIIDATSGAYGQRKQEYIARYKEEKQGQAIEYFKTHSIANEQDLQQAFASKINTLNNKHTIDRSALNMVQTNGKQLDLVANNKNLVNSQVDDLKNTVARQLQQGGEKINHEHTAMGKQYMAESAKKLNNNIITNLFGRVKKDD